MKLLQLQFKIEQGRITIKFRRKKKQNKMINKPKIKKTSFINFYKNYITTYFSYLKTFFLQLEFIQKYKRKKERKSQRVHQEFNF